jgi:hypothetical protein
MCDDVRCRIAAVAVVQIESEQHLIFNIFIRVPRVITESLADRAQKRLTDVKMNHDETGEDDGYIDADMSVRGRALLLCVDDSGHGGGQSEG